MESCGWRQGRVGIGTLVGLAIACLGGCGPTDRPATIPISGSVLINGEAPGEIGKIYFTPTHAAPGYSLRPASGSFNAEGKYRVMSWAPDDGLVPGHYTVSVVPNDAKKTSIPERFHISKTSGLEVDVPADESSIQYDIKVVTQ